MYCRGSTRREDVGSMEACHRDDGRIVRRARAAGPAAELVAQVHPPQRPAGRHVGPAVDRRRELVRVRGAHEGPTARQVVALRSDDQRAAERQPQEVVRRRRRVLGDAEVAPHAAEVPARLCRGAEAVETDVPVRLRVAERDVGVDVDVVGAVHLPGVVDLELRRARRQLDAAQGEAAGILVETHRGAAAAQRRAGRVGSGRVGSKRTCLWSGRWKKCAVALEARDRGPRRSSSE
jgi:hypothetical protein